MNKCDLYKKDEGRKVYNPAVLTKLVQNFRSHKTILELPNSKFYDMELQVNVPAYFSYMRLVTLWITLSFKCANTVSFFLSVSLHEIM